MKGILLSAVLLILTATGAADADIKARTDDGREVILSGDGTWHYIEDNQDGQPEPGSVFTKSEGATNEIKGKKGLYSMWIIPGKWSVMDKTLNQAAEFSFIHSGSEAYAMIISERTRIPLDTLQQIVFQNAQAAAPDAKVTRSQDRTVNGQPMRYLVIEGTVSGIPFVYNYYLYSGRFSMQVITFTSRDLYDEHRQDFIDFLNGVTVNP